MRFPETERLLAACQQVVDGSGDASALTSALGSRMAAIEHMHGDFLASVARFEPADAIAWAAAIDGVERGYSACQAALAGLRQAAQRADRETMRRGMAELEAATEQWYVALTAVNEIRVQAGPTRWVPVNDLLAAATAEVARRAAAARNYLQHCRDEMHAAEPDSDATARIVAAFEEALGAVAGMADAAESGDEAGIESARTQLSNACGEAARELEAYHGQAREAGLAHLWRRRLQLLQSGVASAPEAVRDLEVFEEQLREQRSFFELLGYAHSTDAYVTEPIGQALEGLRRMLEVTAQWRTALGIGDVAATTAGLEEFAAGASAYQDASARVADVLGRQGKIVCPRCEAVNEPHHRFCTNCAAVLPTGPQDRARASFDIAEGARFDDDRPVMTENVHRVLDETARFYDQKIDRKAYVATLDWMEERLRSSEEELARRPALDADGVRAQLDVVLEAARSGQTGVGVDSGTPQATHLEPQDLGLGETSGDAADDVGPRDLGLGDSVPEPSAALGPVAEGEAITPQVIADAEARAAELLRIVTLSTDTRELMSAGTARMRAGLMCLRQFADTRERSHLADGVSTLWEGSQQIVQATRVALQIENSLVARRSAAPAAEPADQFTGRSAE